MRTPLNRIREMATPLEDSESSFTFNDLYGDEGIGASAPEGFEADEADATPSELEGTDTAQIVKLLMDISSKLDQIIGGPAGM